MLGLQAYHLAWPQHRFVPSLLTELGQYWFSESVSRILVPLSASELPPNCDRAVLVPTLKDKLKLPSVVKLRQRTLVTLESSIWEPVDLGRGQGMSLTGPCCSLCTGILSDPENLLEV